MSRLSEDGGAPEVRGAFRKTMSGDYDNANGAPYTPLELFRDGTVPHDLTERRQPFGD
jgi:hypothetical protein